MKKVFLKTLMATSVVAPVVVTPFVTTSCGDVSIEISASDKTKTVTIRDFSINFNISNFTFHEVKVELVDEKSGAISIIDDSFDPLLKYGQINFHIDESVHYNKDFSFSIQFTVTRGTKVEVVLVEGFKVYYNPDPEEWIDHIKIDDKVDEQTGSWDFNYDIQFSDMPLSTIEVNIINDDSRMLSLGQKHIPVQKEGQKYIAHIPVKLSLDVYKNTILPFELYLDFTNSYGLSQHEKITDMIASFKRKNTDTIPLEYLNIDQDTKWLNGFNPNIKPEAIQSYSILRVPSDIAGVGRYAFSNQETCKNIEQIIFEGGGTSVQEFAFFGCINVTELDVSVFNDEVYLPAWLDPNIPKNPLFNSGSMSCLHPFMWVGSKRNIDDMKYVGVQLGFYNPYVLNPAAVFPNEFYNVVNDPLTGENVLQNVDQGMLSVAKDYRIIRLPQGINRIAANALSPLSYYPYNAPNSQPRILILNKELTTIEGENAFSYLGLSGPVYLPPNLKVIPKRTFDHATQYYDQATPFSPDEYEFIIDFHTSKSLTTIGDEAFANLNTLSIVNGFLPSLTGEGSNVGSHIFQNCPRLWYLDLSYLDTVPTTWNEDAFSDLGTISGGTHVCVIPNNTHTAAWTTYMNSKLDTSIWTIQTKMTDWVATPIRKEW